MGQRYVLIHERSIKEWTRATDFSSSWQFLKTNRFGDANRRGSPSRIEGLGSSMKGVWGRVPQWVWATPEVCFCHAGHGGFAKRRQASQTPINFDALASKYV
jgi:hypothetical protein